MSPDTLVLHYTGMATAAAALDRLTDPAAKVSAHYVVDEAGTVWRLVADDEVAWHAGLSAWRGRRALNVHSIGIEIVNAGHDGGLPPFPDVQIGAVIDLARSLVERWAIRAVDVVGHSDVAPMRKADPGERFPWARLAAGGVGLWPPPKTDARPPVPSVTAALGRIGYVLEEAPTPTSICGALLAFQRRFLPTLVDGRESTDVRRRLGEVEATYLADGEIGRRPIC
ncbi:MAG: N-acetylmuramoyl-L-alanine amidase [Pseudomonadota bacterium]